MSIAATAREVLRSLDRREQAEQIEVLAALDSAGRAEVRRALAGVKRNAKIHVPKLVESARRTIAERIAKRPPGNAARYELSLAGADYDDLKALPDAELHRLVTELRAAHPPFTEHATATADADDIQPDPEDDDDAEDAQPKRKRIVRRRLRRRAEREPEKPRPSFFCGPKVFGPHTDDRRFGEPVDLDRSYESFPPPWLIDDGDNPNEGDDYDVDVETHAVA